MNLATARRLLRRRLQEEEEDQWTNQELDELINLAILEEQKEFARYLPDGHLDVWWTDIANGERFVDIPSGLMFETEVGVADSDAPTGYRELGRRNYFALRNERSGDDKSYARFSTKFYLGWTPTADITDGIQVIGVPALTVSGDNTVIPLHVSLHYAIVLRAQIMAEGENKENMEAVWAELDRIHKNLDVVGVKSGGQPETINLPAKDY